jgi:hypothetical protein
MSRIINYENAGKERKQRIREIVLALREMMRQTETNNYGRDLVAFIVIALDEINNSIDTSVEAWEKRGYWIKADRFRMEWVWSGQLSKPLREALVNNDWTKIATIVVQIATKLNDVDIPQRNRLGTPWVGAWERLTVTFKK